MVCAPQKESLSSAVRASGGSVAGQWKLKVKVTQSRPTLCDPMDCASVECSRPEEWRGQLFPSPGGLPNPGTERRSPALRAGSLPAEPLGGWAPLLHEWLCSGWPLMAPRLKWSVSSHSAPTLPGHPPPSPDSSVLSL